VAALKLSVCAPIYTVSTTLGGSQAFDLQLDTGSGPLAVASNACTSCGDAGVAPLYAPGSSAVDEHQRGAFDYVSGKVSGEIYQDSVALNPQTDAPLKFVAIDTQDQFFVPLPQLFFQPPLGCSTATGNYEGIIGFSPSGDLTPGTTSFFDQFVATAHAPNVFATELCPNGGILWLGGYDSTFTTGAPQYTPILSRTASLQYGVSLNSVTVGDKTVPVVTADNPNAIVDTGTVFFAVPQAVYDAITSVVAASRQFQAIFGNASWFSNPQTNCKVLSQTKAELDAMLPPLTLTFGSGPSISIQAPATESYIAQYVSGGQDHWCPTLLPMAPLHVVGNTYLGTSAILGAPVLRSSIVIFDRQNQRIGFAPHTPCP
jgi:hypothetical protein